MDILDHEKLNLVLFSQVVSALNKVIDGLEVISGDIEDGYLSLRGKPSPAIETAGGKIKPQIREFTDYLEGYRSLFIGEGVDYEQFQKVALSEAKREEKKLDAEKPNEEVGEETSLGKHMKQVGGSRAYLP